MRASGLTRNGRRRLRERTWIIPTFIVSIECIQREIISTDLGMRLVAVLVVESVNWEESELLVE